MKYIIILVLFTYFDTMAQFKGHSGIYYLGTANIPISPVNYSNPDISGVVVRFRWNDIEPTPGNFNWLYIDGELSKALNAHKKVSLQPLGVPDWMLNLGAKQYLYIDKNTFHSTYGQIVGGIIPWDSVYLEKYKLLLANLSEKYSTEATVSYINTIGGSFSRNLPDSVITDTLNNTRKPFWEVYNYNADTFAVIINQMTDLYMKLFPNTPLWCSVDYVKFETNASKRPINYLASLITKHGIDNYPDRFGVWREDLSACNPQTTISNSSHWNIIKEHPCRNGAQMLWNVQDGPDRMNKCGVSPNEKTNVMDSAIKRGLSLGMRYIEIYGVDITDASLKTIIQNSNLELLAKGKECENTTNVKNENKLDLFLYPNPSSDYIKISNYNGVASVFNIIGEELWSGVVNNNTQIDIQPLTQGVYYLKTSSNTLAFYKY